jgi:hypothetical protein
MTPEDYKYITTLMLSVAGAQTTILIAFITLLYQASNRFLDAKFKAIEDRLDKIEGVKLIKAS